MMLNILLFSFLFDWYHKMVSPKNGDTRAAFSPLPPFIATPLNIAIICWLNTIRYLSHAWASAREGRGEPCPPGFSHTSFKPPDFQNFSIFSSKYWIYSYWTPPSKNYLPTPLQSYSIALSTTKATSLVNWRLFRYELISTKKNCFVYNLSKIERNLKPLFSCLVEFTVFW